MRRRIVLTLLALLVTLGPAIVQPAAQQPVVDSQKSRQELETMEGILGTTLGYAVKRLGNNQAAEGDRAFRFHRMDGDEVSGYYVFGQGAVFMIPISALGRGQGTDFEVELGDIGELVGPAELAVATAAAGLEAALAEPGTADAQKAKENAEKLQQQAQERQKDMTRIIEKQKARMQQLQEQAKKRRAEMEERRKELIGRLGQVTADLKDALARYGDSLSIVKPEESVTIILSDDRGSRWMRWGDNESSGSICHVLTVRKSLVTDLKSGKITREEFDRRVVDYSY